MAQLFQDGVDRMQQWFISTEQELAELRNAERVMLHLTEAAGRAKVGNISNSRAYHRKHSNNNYSNGTKNLLRIYEIYISGCC